MSTSTNILILAMLMQIIWIVAESPRWDLMQQDEYGANAHRIEVDWFNKTYLNIEKFELVKYNRTYRRVFNASMYLLKEVGQHVTASIQFYKMHTNEYKFFPLTATLQVCQEYKRNSFRMKDLLANYTNFKICPQKSGYLYAVHLRGDAKKFPPLIPSGDYKLTGKVNNEGDTVIDLSLYFSIIYKNKGSFW